MATNFIVSNLNNNKHKNIKGNKKIKTANLAKIAKFAV
jgi:hypothetical protein